MGRGLTLMMGGLAGFAASACSSSEPLGDSKQIDAREYLGIETRKLDETLVSFLVRMKGAEDKQDVSDYARCAAARYTLIRGYGFARHVRTNVQERGGIWAADAVYTISAALPDGLQTIDAEVVVENCAADGIPTV